MRWLWSTITQWKDKSASKFRRAPLCAGASTVDVHPTLPAEIWRSILEMLLSDYRSRTQANDVVSVTQVNRALNIQGEAILYRQVSIGPDIARLKSFLLSVSSASEHSSWRASLVKSLRMDIPWMVWYLDPPAQTRGRWARLTRRIVPPVETPERVVNALPQSLEDIMIHVFSLLVNLQELDFYNLERYRDVLRHAHFSLRELKTQAGVLIPLPPPPSPPWLDAQNETVQWASDDAMTTPLQSLSTLSLDMHWIYPEVACLSFYPIRHLTLDNIPEQFYPYIQPSLPQLPMLISLRLVMHSHHPSQGWPTDVLLPPRSLAVTFPKGRVARSPLPSLNRLEVCEDKSTRTSYLPILHLDPFLDNVKTMCPVLSTLVWRLPSRVLVFSPNEYSSLPLALKEYSTELFARWDAFERFELPGVYSDRLQEVGWTAFIRDVGGSIVQVPCKYHEHGWKSVKA